MIKTQLDFTGIRTRDNDKCHWCGQTVDFTTRHSGTSGCYDFIDSNKKPRATEANTVVSCRACEASRRKQATG
ncbi:hypothetical protein [Rothia nasimurium]|uniref:hypothetical protein n=1 Tax=Rothia nasimurium TaxID=85336 RepID=UPI001F1B1661|nr:hypothetical protein [Rothia nasimurium]